MKYVMENTDQTHAPVTHSHRSMYRALTCLRSSLVAFALGVAVCVMLRPSDVLGHGGLSFYGNFSRTFVPYAVGMFAASYYLFKACLELRAFSATRAFGMWLQWVAVAMVGVVLTPSLSSAWAIQDMHVVFSFVVFVIQAGLALRYLLMASHELFDWGLLIMQLAAIIGVVLSFRIINVLPAMLPAQVLATSSFGLLLIRAVRAQTKRNSSMMVVQ